MIPDSCHLVSGKLPWGQLPALIPDTSCPSFIYRAFRGWENNLWHDGPTIVCIDGIIQSYALPGKGPPPLPVDRRSSHAALAEWIVAHESSAWKKSLALALRERLALTDAAYQLRGRLDTPSQALMLLGLRTAFPTKVFYRLDFPDDLKPQWKRLAQNLNISTWAAPAQLKNLAELDIETLSEAWPHAAAQRFWAQFKIPVLPGKLAQHFTHW